jgi:carbonic anhydrase
MTSDNHSSFTAEESLKRLMDGNARFVGGQARFSTLPADVLPGLVSGQRPYATILGCSDSRVPPELVFDAGFGELFVVRVAGNTLGPSIEGTLQYARAHLHTPLLVVMGHEGCGAVKAAIDSKLHGIQHRSRIARLLENILPALDDLDTKLPPDARVEAAVEANVRWTVRQVLESPEMQSAPVQDRISVVCAVYGLQTGHVRFLE